MKVSLNKKIGFVDTKNKIKIPFIHDDADTIKMIGMIGQRVTLFQYEDSAGVIRNKEISSKIDYNFINFSEGVCSVIKGGKYGFIDTMGKVVIPFIFDGADNFYNKIDVVKMQSKYGAINRFGKIVIPYTYDFLAVYEDKVLYAILNGKIHFLNYTGKEIPKQDILGWGW